MKARHEGKACHEGKAWRQGKKARYEGKEGLVPGTIAKIHPEFLPLITWIVLKNYIFPFHILRYNFVFLNGICDLYPLIENTS